MIYFERKTINTIVAGLVTSHGETKFSQHSLTRRLSRRRLLIKNNYVRDDLLSQYKCNVNDRFGNTALKSQEPSRWGCKT